MGNQKSLNAIIIDDSEESINNLLKIIESFFSNEINVIKTYNSGIEAIKDISSYNSDIIFLDVEMPGLNGFDVKALFSDDITAKIVIISGKRHYALEAINTDVCDFLTKPIVLSDFRNCITKIRNELIVLSMDHNTEHQVIIVSGHNKTYFFEYNMISRIQANGPYSIVYYKDEQINVSKHLKYFEDILPVDLFFRVHRSHIINYNQIQQIVKFDNHSDIIMNDGSKINVLNLKKLK